MEKWSSIIAYHGLYQISDKGRVRSLKRKNRKILKENKDGKITLSIDGIRKSVFVKDLI